ncbi:MAG: DNA polymerase domain-containing protein [Anaerolineae bacterium]
MKNTTKLEGWLLQTYLNEERGMTVWFIDDLGERHRFQLGLDVTFYAAGPFPRLRQLWRFLQAQPFALSLERQQKRELFSGDIDLLAVTVDAAQQKRLFYPVLSQFPDLDYFDADVLPALHLTARSAVFPLARCRLTVEDQQIVELESLDSTADIEYALPALRLLYIEPECDPFHKPPSYVDIKADKQYRIAVTSTDTFLNRINAVINRFDPDMIVTAHGDSWLFPYLFDYCQKHDLSYFNPCRDQDRRPLVKDPLSYQTYGQTLYRASQTYLFGRIHIDARNLTQIYESGLVGVFEQSRITGMPLQDGARKSPGAGFSAMQVVTALKEGVLVPFRKAQAERPKTALQLLRADQGGLIGQPKLGIHYGAIEFDFISMYPAIITNFNLSPETVFKSGAATAYVPQLGYSVDMSTEGLIPKTLRPLVKKRISLKSKLATIDRRDCRYREFKQKNNAQKSLQTVAFGYMGHKHFKYTQIEVHESITAYSREAMLITKEILEEAGFETIHLYVDGIYFKKDEPTSQAELDQLLKKIEEKTGLPIGNEGVYKWIIFLPSKEDPLASVPNRYFGTFANGEVKVRGIEAKTRDTPPFIKEAQMAIINIMAGVPFGERLEPCMPQALAAFRGYIDKLRNGQANVESLVITQVLTREVGEYKVNTRVARAAHQLEAAGKLLSKGMRIRYLLSRGEPGVLAWDAPAEITLKMLDVPLYLERLISAGHTVFQMFGISKDELRRYLLDDVVQLKLPKIIRGSEQRLPLLYRCG